jgi:mono/diheme cytochrome c family protein
MKKMKVLGTMALLVAIVSCFSNKAFIEKEHQNNGEGYIAIPPFPQVLGNPDSGYQYLITGDYLKSGFPLSLFKLTGAKEKENFLRRSDINQDIPYDYTAIAAPNGENVVAPNCLQCHAQRMGDSLIVGLGNSLFDFSTPQIGTATIVDRVVMGGKSESLKAASKNLLTAIKTTAPYLVAESRGVNLADRLTAVLAAHRDPLTFEWKNEAQLKIPSQVIPTDVPAWWLLKKKNGMFYNGFGRGDFSRFLMASNLLTVTDTSEAAEVFSHFHHVLAYIYSLQAPKYPGAIDQQLAAVGEKLFEDNCASCHGNYGANSQYPNLLIPAEIIQTDPMVYQSNFSSSQYLEWFDKSWFKTGERQASLVPFKGYIAPPLDGVWITAPYLHNGSVPTLEMVINSKERPAFWARDFSKPKYNVEKMGWEYTVSDKQYTRSTYNTQLPGYSNKGHYFGDKLTEEERVAVVEYLKTL